MSSTNPPPDAPPERDRGTALKKNLAVEPSSGTKGFQTAGSHPSVLPNAPHNGCHRVTIRPSVWPAELLLGMMQA